MPICGDDDDADYADCGRELEFEYMDGGQFNTGQFGTGQFDTGQFDAMGENVVSNCSQCQIVLVSNCPRIHHSKGY